MRSIFQRNTRNAYRIENKADETTVYIYDEVSFWGVDASVFVKDFNKITSKLVNIRVNSPGGSVFDGTAIFNAVKQHPARVVAHVDGLAASIASVIVMAADEVVMAENAFMMIHEPWSMMAGGAEDFRKEAELLDKVRGTIAKTYMDKSGKSEEDVLALMEAETWFTAQEALDAGFIDSIAGVSEAKATMFDLSVFAKVPDKLKSGEDKDLTAREVERILRDAGCPIKQAKAIISEGLAGEKRDVSATPEPESIEPVATVVDEVIPVVNPKEFDKRMSSAALLARADRVLKKLI